MLISVIIPVYNVAQYIERCLDSVLSQTYKNLEIILVDDCSPDNSILIAKNLINNAQTKREIQFIAHSENKGLSEARNTGIKQAKGEYLFFLDSDDYLQIDAIENLVVTMNNEKPDLVVGEVLKISKNKKTKISVDLPCSNLTNNSEIRKAFLSNKIYEMAWNKLINRNFIISNDLFFKVGLYYEDTLWTFQLMKVISSLFICRQVTYNYYITQNSITHKTKKKHLKDALFIIKTISDEMDSFSSSKEINNLFKLFIFRHVKSALLRASDLGYSEWVKFYEEIKPYYDNSSPTLEKLKVIGKIEKIIHRGPLFINYLQYKTIRIIRNRK